MEATSCAQFRCGDGRGCKQNGASGGLFFLAIGLFGLGDCGNAEEEIGLWWQGPD